MKSMNSVLVQGEAEGGSTDLWWAWFLGVAKLDHEEARDFTLLPGISLTPLVQCLAKVRWFQSGADIDGMINNKDWIAYKRCDINFVDVIGYNNDHGYGL